MPKYHVETQDLTPLTDVVTVVLCKVRRKDHPAAARFEAAAADLESRLTIDHPIGTPVHRLVCLVVYGGCWLLNVGMPYNRLDKEE